MSAGAARRRLAVAASGGPDSTALLHCTYGAALRAGVDVVALHVNHGLQADADGWQAEVERQCARWSRGRGGLSFAAMRLQAKPARGDSIEAWARRQRYAALAAMARQHGAGIVLLAHHRRDQAETVLLQALRGAGPAGLAAMPHAVERHGLLWVRPWLDQPHEAIEHYLQRHRLKCVRDPMNQAPRFARSRLRAAVWPALSGAFEEAEVALAATARRMQEVRLLTEEVAATDLGAIAGGDALEVPRWLALSPARRANALRAWLDGVLDHGAPESLVQRLLEELPRTNAARWPAEGAKTLALYRGRLVLQADRAALAARPLADASLSVDLSRPGVHPVPEWGGAFEVTPVREGGAAVADLGACTLVSRHGGERWQAHPQGPPRSLKKQYQALGVPAWSRGGPLVMARGRLLYVPGLGLDARVRAEGGPQRRLEWRAGASPAPAVGSSPGPLLHRS